MRRVLMYAIPIVMAAGLLAAVANSPVDDGQDLASGGDSPELEQGGKVTGTTLPAVIETPDTTVPATAPPAPETTTTTAAPPPPPTTVTTAFRPRPRPRPAASPRPATPPTTAAPAPPVVQQPEPVDCGTGSASARTRLVNDGGYRLVATVVNESTKAIQLDSLVVRATYADGTRNFNVNVGGRVVEPRPGQSEMDFDIPESAGAGAPTDFQIVEFKFHTAGLPQCASS